MERKLISEELLLNFVHCNAHEICGFVNRLIAYSQAGDELMLPSTLSDTLKKTGIDLSATLSKLPVEERILLACVEVVRRECDVEGRRWLSVMRVVQERRSLATIRDAYDLIQRLYGERWEEVKFDYRNAVRNYCGDFAARIGERNVAKAPVQYVGVVSKYNEIIDKLDGLLGEYMVSDTDNREE